MPRSLPPLLRLLEELRARPGVGVTFLSSGGTVYGNPTAIPVTEDHPTEPLTSYGVMNLAGENYVLMYGRLYGVPVRVLRCSNVYGEFQPGAARGSSPRRCAASTRTSRSCRSAMGATCATSSMRQTSRP